MTNPESKAAAILWIDAKGAVWSFDGSQAQKIGVPMTKAETSAAKLLGRKGGLSRSEAKAEAARENGKRGGRPLECKHCDKPAEWQWFDPNTGKSANICERCLTTLSHYATEPMWRFTLIPKL